MSRALVIVFITFLFAAKSIADIPVSGVREVGSITRALSADTAASSEVTPQITPQVALPKTTPDSETLIAPEKPTSQAPVVISGDTLFVIYNVLGVFSAQERADKITEKIEMLINNPLYEHALLTLKEGIGATAITAGDQVIDVISSEDARLLGGLRQEIAAGHLKLISQIVDRERARRTPRTMVVGALITALATVALIMFWRILTLLAYKLKDRLAGRHVLRLAGGAPLGLGTAADRRSDRIIVAIRLLRLMLQLALLYSYVTFVTGFFYVTQGLHISLTYQLRGVLNWAGPKFVGFLPNLFILATVATVTYIILQLLRLVFVSLARGTIRWPGFQPEWAYPTYRLVSIVLSLFALILLWPNLPGSGSPVFTGVAIFIGVLLLIGSAVIGANLVAGIVVGYTVPFRVGDKVRVAGTTGEVISWTLLMTRLRTEKNVEVTIPNALVLTGQIVNFSRPGAQSHLIVPTAVTLSYGVPGAQAQELLMEAALRTTNVLKDPLPFVLQKKLGPELVNYELNVYVSDAAHSSQVQSELYQHIRDVFGAANISIHGPANGREDISVESAMDDHLPRDTPIAFRLFPPMSRLFRRERSAPPASESERHTE